MGTRSHKSAAPKQVRMAILSMSSSRTVEEDQSGRWIAKQAAKEGHEVVFHEMIPDDRNRIARTVLDVIGRVSPQVMILTGGTGISAKDVTIETLRPLLRKEMTAFGALFAQLSYEQIDAAAILSRSLAGIVGQTVLFCLPGSLKACKLACHALIFPELGHVVKHALEP